MSREEIDRGSSTAEAKKISKEPIVVVVKKNPIRLSYRFNVEDLDKIKKAAEKGDISAKFKWLYANLTHKASEIKEVDVFRALLEMNEKGIYPDVMYGILQARTLEWVAISFSNE